MPTAATSVPSMVIPTTTTSVVSSAMMSTTTTVFSTVMTTSTTSVSSECTDHTYAEELESLKRKLTSEEQKKESVFKKLRSSRKKVKRLEDAVLDLRKELNVSYEKFGIDKSKQILIDQAASDISYQLLSRSVQNDNDYGPEIRKFALTLNFYSRKAYNFVRKSFNNALPHGESIEQMVLQNGCLSGIY